MPFKIVSANAKRLSFRQLSFGPECGLQTLLSIHFETPSFEVLASRVQSKFDETARTEGVSF